MGLSVLDARLAGDAIRHLLAVTPRLAGAQLAGPDPIHVPLAQLPLPGFFAFTRGGTLPYFRIADDAGGERWVECTDADQPRISSPDGKLSRRGLLIEPVRRNDCKRSRSMDSAAWTSIGSPIVLANDAFAPDGAETAETIEDNDVGSTERQIQNTMGLALTEHAFSVFGQHIAGTGGRMRTNDGTGGILFTDLATDGLWERVDHQDVITSANVAEIGLVPAAPGADALGKYAFWLAQVEEGEYPTSPFAAGAAASTRNGDNAVGAVAELGGRLTTSRGRLRQTFVPNWATTEEDGRNYLVSVSASDGIYYQNGSWRLHLGGITRDTLATTNARGDVYVTDLSWGSGATSLDVWLNGAFQGRASAPANVPSAVAGLYLGGRPDGTVQASGVFPALVIG